MGTGDAVHRVAIPAGRSGPNRLSPFNYFRHLDGRRAFKSAILSAAMLYCRLRDPD
jgi:hypothetical protein